MTKRIMSDYIGDGFETQGNLEIHGDFDVYGDVVVHGTLLVTGDIKIIGGCTAEKILCAGTVDISGALECNEINFAKSIKIGYGNQSVDPDDPDFKVGGSC